MGHILLVSKHRALVKPKIRKVKIAALNGVAVFRVHGESKPKTLVTTVRRE